VSCVKETQAWVSEDRYVLHLEEVPEAFRDIARYLERPLKDQHLRRQLHAVQELEEFLAIQEANMARLSEDLREALIKREEELRQKEEAERLKEEERRQKEEVIDKLDRLLKSMGRSSAEISAETELAEDQFEKL
jgi:L-lactate utilization protein LutB